jgi:hypothetical protein
LSTSDAIIKPKIVRRRMATHHYCCGSRLDCSGINKCPPCFEVFNKEVVAKAMMKTTAAVFHRGSIPVAELNERQFWGLFSHFYEESNKELQANMSRDPELLRRAIDIRPLEAMLSARAAEFVAGAPQQHFGYAQPAASSRPHGYGSPPSPYAPQQTPQPQVQPPPYASPPVHQPTPGPVVPQPEAAGLGFSMSFPIAPPPGQHQVSQQPVQPQPQPEPQSQLQAQPPPHAPPPAARSIAEFPPLVTSTTASTSELATRRGEITVEEVARSASPFEEAMSAARVSNGVSVPAAPPSAPAVTNDQST